MAFDEQIFAIQRHGGISRVFAELAHQFIANPELGVELQPVAAPLVNEYLLRDPETARALDVRPSRHWAPCIARSLARRRHQGPVDIVHNTFYLPRALADYPQAKRVVTVHDMIPEIYPETRRRLDFVTVKRRYVEQADHVVCVSESTREDLQRIYGPLSVPVSVIHSGVGTNFHPTADRIAGWPDSYLLHVGHRNGYKGGRTLFAAFAEIASLRSDLYLVLAGGGAITPAESRQIEELRIRHRIFHSQVHDRDMPKAYSGADAFVFPSEYEGFGLPVLEAMASGCPTVLSTSSSLPEVGADAAEYFEAGDASSLAESIFRVLTDEGMARELIQKGKKRAAAFTWISSARQFADLYRSLSA